MQSSSSVKSSGADRGRAATKTGVSAVSTSEAARRCSESAVRRVRRHECCSSRCMDRFDTELLLQERKKFSYVEAGTSRSRNGRMEYLFEFCRDHGMITKKDSHGGSFVPTIYGTKVCWNALAHFLGVSKSRITEVANMAKENRKLVKPRYETYSTRERDLAKRTFILEFIGDVFRSVGEYQPDTSTVILPFNTKVLLCQYVRARWSDQFGGGFPTDRTLRRYLQSPDALSYISTSRLRTTAVTPFERENSTSTSGGVLASSNQDQVLRVVLRRTPRFGKCPDCCESQLALSHSKCSEDRQLFFARYKLHLDSVRHQRLVYYSLKSASIRAPDELLTIIADGPDQYVTRLPHMGPEWCGRTPKFDDSCQPRLKLELVICHGRRGPNIFLYADPPDKSHGANMVIEALERTLAQLKDSGGLPLTTGHLHVQLDNPTGENKNRWPVGEPLACAVAHGGPPTWFVLGFLPPGHTHEDVDMRHSQYCRYLAQHKFVNAQEVCDLVERCLSDYVPSAVATEKMVRKQKFLDTPMEREYLRPKASPMYHIRDWKSRYESVPRIEGITSAYAFRVLMVPYFAIGNRLEGIALVGEGLSLWRRDAPLQENHGGHHILRSTGDSRTLEVLDNARTPEQFASTESLRKVFVSSETFKRVKEPGSEAAHTDKHDVRAAETLERLARASPLLWPREDVQHAIELQRGTYKYLAHESELTKLPRFVLDSSSSEPIRSREARGGVGVLPNGLSGRAESSRAPQPKARQGIAGTAIFGESASMDVRDREIFEGLAHRELKYCKPATVVVKHKREYKSSLNFKKYSVSSDGERLAISSLTQLRVDELPKHGRFAFVRVVGGLHDRVPQCPAIARVLAPPDWDAVPANLRADQELTVHWYTFDEKLLADYGIGALARGVCQPMVKTKSKKRGKSEWWMDNVVFDTLLAWNFDLTGSRHLPKSALVFLEHDLKIDLSGISHEERVSDDDNDEERCPKIRRKFP